MDITVLMLSLAVIIAAGSAAWANIALILMSKRVRALEQRAADAEATMRAYVSAYTQNSSALGKMHREAHPKEQQ